MTSAVGGAPAISVIIPAFNAETTLAEQLTALSRQRVSFDWEILVCDNGSTDGTADFVTAWAERLPQLALVDASARRGAGAARNIGAAAARSALLAFCDADDIVSDEWLGEMREALRSHPLVAGANDFARLHSHRALEVSRLQDSLITMPYWPRFKAGGGGNLGVVASVFAEVGGFDESLLTGEDIDLCWRIQLAGYPIARCETAIAYIRKRRGLVAVWRQAYSYGDGNRVLKAKYASFIEDYWRRTGGPALAAARRTHPVRTAALLFRRLRPNGLADTAWQFGEAAGVRRTPRGAAIEPLELPPN